MADEKDTPKQADAAMGQAKKAEEAKADEVPTESVGKETKPAAAEGSGPLRQSSSEASEAKEEVKKEPAPEPKKEEKAEAKAAEGSSPDTSEEVSREVEVPAKFKDIVEKIENMAVLELNELVKLLEKKFGVSAAAVAVAGSAGGDAGAEEKDEFTVELTSFGEAKIPVMKVVKEILGLGLKEAKDIVEGAPSVLKEGAKKVEAEEMKTKIEEAGGKVELK